MFSYCPTCYSSPMIINSHKCKDSWELWYNEGKDYDEQVKRCASYMKKHRYEPIFLHNH